MNILFIYDYGININSYIAEGKLLSGLEAINRSMSLNGVKNVSGNPINFKVASDSQGTFAHVRAPAGICGSTSPCTGTYEMLIDSLVGHAEVIKLRQQYRADIVIFIRNFVDSVGEAQGQAPKPVEVTLNNANDASYAVIYSHARPVVFLHEIGHLLGAGHTKLHPEKPGTAPRRAHLSFGQQMPNCGSRPIASFSATADPTTCESELTKVWNQTITNCNRIPCEESLNFSNHFYGSSDDNNRAIIKLMARVMTNYDQYYGALPTQKPNAVIHRVSGNNKANYEQCWNAVGSTDPSNSPLLTFRWQIKKNGAIYHQEDKPNVSSLFCWTPSISTTEDFSINLSLTNANGDTGTTSKNFTIVYDSNYISAPVLGGSVDSSVIKLTWSQPQGAVSYFQVHEKGNEAPWKFANNSSDRIEYFIKVIRSGTFRYRVRGCTEIHICGDFSNIQTYVISTDKPLD